MSRTPKTTVTSTQLQFLCKNKNSPNKIPHKLDVLYQPAQPVAKKQGWVIKQHHHKPVSHYGQLGICLVYCAKHSKQDSIILGSNLKISYQAAGSVSSAKMLCPDCEPNLMQTSFSRCEVTGANHREIICSDLLNFLVLIVLTLVLNPSYLEDCKYFLACCQQH